MTTRPLRQTRAEYLKNKTTPRIYDDAGILTHKRCSMCREMISVDDFNNHPTHKDGYNNTCRNCAHARWHEKINERRLPYLLNRMRSTASKLQVPFDLELSDIIVPTHCPVLGIPLEFGRSTPGKKWRDNSPSVDRIVPEKGYVKGNIVIVSYRANRIKNDSTLVELQMITDFYTTLSVNKSQC